MTEANGALDMNNKRITPAIRLYDDIKGQIQARKLSPHDPVLPANALTEIYGISYPTVHRVLKRLVDEGLIYRIQGKGSFVAEPETGRSRPVQRLVGILMHTEGHLFHEFYEMLLTQLQGFDYWPVTQNIGAPAYEANRARHFRRLLTMNPMAVIANGLALDYDVVRNSEGTLKRLMLIQQCNAVRRVDADMFFSDYELGGRLLAEHLIGQGHTYFAIQVPDYFDSGERDSVVFSLRRIGFLRELAGHGYDETHLTTFPLSMSDAALLSLFTRIRGAPTAVVAMTDHHGKLMIDRLSALGLKVPDDVAVTGYFNTPWAEQTTPTLTSIEIDVALIASRIVEHLVKVEGDPRTPFVQTLIRPTLVVRESTRSGPA